MNLRQDKTKVNFTPERDPRIRALASQSAREIKALTHAHNQQIEGIYRRFLAQAAAIKEQNQCTSTQTTITEGQDDESAPIVCPAPVLTSPYQNARHDD